MERISERLAIVSTLDPVSQSATTVTGDSIDMNVYSRVIFVLLTGALGTNATVDLAIKGDTASNGSYATTITGKSLTQLVKASNDNNQAVIEVTADAVAAQGFRYVRPSLTVGTAASLIALVALAQCDYSPAADYDLSTVAQIV